MQNVNRLRFLVILVLFLADCQRQSAPTATTPAVVEAAASEESTAIPTATATPVPSPISMEE
ncbi:MAG: hypothetical protein RRC07_09815 [Anaerolineae bacterium]|nr:hypothetical protein [Anaerolineae bacterium]